MGDEVGPVDELLVNLLKGLGVVVGELDALPEVGGRVGTLNSLDVEVNDAWKVSKRLSSCAVICWAIEGRRSRPGCHSYR